ncbi:MAG: hypothetical protein C4348_01555 [Patescibacteria group bacterium]
MKGVTLNWSFWLFPLFVIIFWIAKEIFFAFFLGFVLGIVIQNFSNYLSLKTKIPYLILVFFLYIFLVLFITFLIYSIFKIITNEFPDFYSRVNDILKTYGLKLEKVTNWQENIFEFTKSYFPNFILFIYSIFGNFISFLLVFVVSLYVALDRNLEKNIFSFIPEEKREELFNLWFRVKRRLSFWIFGQIFLMLIIGLGTFFIITIFNLPYKILISITAGILEAVPILGPTITALLAGFIALINKPSSFLLVLLLFFLLQQIESHFLVPLVMKNAVKLNPLLVLFSLLIVGKLFGFWGVVSVLPILVIITEIFNYFLSKNKLKLNKNAG